MEMEYTKTRSIRHLLCHQEMELLPTRSRHHSIVRNDHKPLAWFLNGKNENTKINRWGLELASYNITFEWISGAKNKAADCLSRLVELPKKHQKNTNGTKPMLINMVKAVTTGSGMRKSPTVKETEKQPPLETNLNKDETPRTG